MLTGQLLRYVLTTAQEADGDMQHEPILAADFPIITLSLSATGGADFTVKVKGSYEPITALPTQYEYLQSTDLNTGAFYSGSAGYVFSADGRVDLEINVNEVNWFVIEVDSYVDGLLTATATLSSNIH